MDLSERILYLAVGGVFGFFFGYIVARLREIKEELDEVIEKEHLLDRDEDGSAKTPRWKDLVLFGVVVLVAVSAFLSGSAAIDQRKQADRDRQAAEMDQIVRCRGAVDTRDVQRATVEAVYNLATATLPEGDDLTPEEKARINNYIDQINRFREEMYSKIKPSSVCLPYVNDDNVTPPPPPYPRFP